MQVNNEILINGISCVEKGHLSIRDDYCQSCVNSRSVDDVSSNTRKGFLDERITILLVRQWADFGRGYETEISPLTECGTECGIMQPFPFNNLQWC